MSDGFLSPLIPIGSSASATAAAHGFQSAVYPLGLSALGSVSSFGFQAPVFPFGISALAVDTAPSVEQAVVNAQIDQVFAVDYGGRYRKCTKDDYRRFCKLRDLMKGNGYGFTIIKNKVQIEKDRRAREQQDEQAMLMYWALTQRKAA